MNNLLCRIQQRYSRPNKPLEVRFAGTKLLHWNGTIQEAWLLHSVVDVYKKAKRNGNVERHRTRLEAAWDAITGEVPNDELLAQIITHYNTLDVIG
jgi:hypothetical protein